MAATFDRELEERLLRYVRIDTESDEASSTTPSTEKQYDLLNLLADELRALGASDVTLTGYGAVLATIPPTTEAATPTVAFLAHVDTTAAFPGTGVEPIVHRSYDGADIALPDDPAAVLSPAAFPYLATKAGDDAFRLSPPTTAQAWCRAG